jgi:hypothetical protein
MQQSHWEFLEKTVLPLLFSSPLFTVGFMYWSVSSGQASFLGAIWKPVLFTLIFLWLWQTSSQRLIDKASYET